MNKMTRFVILLLLVIYPLELSSAKEDLDSGYFFLSKCSKMVEEANQDYFFQGACAGTVKTIMYYSGRFGICQPENVFVGQSVRVIIKYLSNNPEILHQPFAKLAVEALQKSWPCQSK